ncbi:sodium:solute symporter, partial [Bacteroidota bacterium]
VEEFNEFKQLETKLDNGLSQDEIKRYVELKEKSKKAELRSFISYTDPIFFYFLYAFIVGIYTMLGGFRAAAITDAIQGVLIIIFSAILIPVGLSKIGGFSGLHANVPDYMFELFGSATMSEYAWFTIAAMALANLVSIVAVASSMQTAGSAKNEMTARVGMIGGMFTKRLIMILWALAGLIAIALYAKDLHDPDLIWGYMTHNLLFPGAVGLMLIGILAANMSSLDAGSVSYSALFIKNLYKPFVKEKSESHYLFIGRIVIAITLLGGIIVAMYVDNLLELFKYIISIPAIFGASIWLGFIWRRVTKWAVILQVVITILIYAVIPNLFQGLDYTKYHEDLLLETTPKTVTITTSALVEDVNSGIADCIGESIEKMHLIEPVGVFFEKVARVDPSNPESSKIGLGRFHAEIWVLSWFGMDFSNYSKAELVTVRFLFDALFPFLLLFVFSYITKPVSKPFLDRFFAKMHTPVQTTDEKEQQALEDSFNNPEKFESDKLFPRTQWEIMKPSRMDLIGFGGSWVLVGVIILLLWLVVSIT